MPNEIGTKRGASGRGRHTEAVKVSAKNAGFWKLRASPLGAALQGSRKRVKGRIWGAAVPWRGRNEGQSGQETGGGGAELTVDHCPLERRHQHEEICWHGPSSRVCAANEGCFNAPPSLDVAGGELEVNDTKHVVWLVGGGSVCCLLLGPGRRGGYPPGAEDRNAAVRLASANHAHMRR